MPRHGRVANVRCCPLGGDPMTETLQLYSYWRSSAAYRVRIGLNLKGWRTSIVPVHLLRDGGQQHSRGYREINPQELVPTLLPWPAPPRPVAGDPRIPGRILAGAAAVAGQCPRAPPRTRAGAAGRLRRPPAQQPAGAAVLRAGMERAAARARRMGAALDRRGLPRGGGDAGRPSVDRDLLRGRHPRPGRLLPGAAGLQRAPLRRGHGGVSDHRADRAACLALPAFDAARPERQPDAPAPT
jgi:maleylacetoacetate isomerase